MAKIDYFFTLNSPWTYLGTARFIEMVQRHNVEISVKPANFAEIFAQTGGLPLSKRSPQRLAYRLIELARWRKELDIPIVIQPKYFPADETPGVRLVIGAAIVGQNALALSAEIGKSLWELDQNIAELSVLEEAAGRAGIDLRAVRVSAPDDDELDSRWLLNTAEAAEMGIFGAPSYRFEDGEIMWGQDRLAFVSQKLAIIADTAD